MRSFFSHVQYIFAAKERVVDIGYLVPLLFKRNFSSSISGILEIFVRFAFVHFQVFRFLFSHSFFVVLVANKESVLNIACYVYFTCNSTQTNICERSVSSSRKSNFVRFLEKRWKIFGRITAFGCASELHITFAHHKENDGERHWNEPSDGRNVHVRFFSPKWHRDPYERNGKRLKIEQKSRKTSERETQRKKTFTINISIKCLLLPWHFSVLIPLTLDGTAPYNIPLHLF